MPEKEGAEEKTTKDVVTKRQKQLMNKEEYVQEMPDDVKNIMMKGLRKGAGEFSKGGDPKNIIKKGVKSTIKNVIKSKSVQNFLNNEYIPEEGYDVARDQGRVKPSKDKKDATTMPRSKEMEKTRKVNKGPSALERVKADIEKRYGKGAIMNVSKEELDLTKVAEAFGGYIVEKKESLKLKKAAATDALSGMKKDTKVVGKVTPEVSKDVEGLGSRQGRIDATNPKKGGYPRVDDVVAPKGKQKLDYTTSTIGDMKTYKVDPKTLKNNPTGKVNPVKKTVKKTAAVGAKQASTKLVTKPKKVVTTPASLDQSATLDKISRKARKRIPNPEKLARVKKQIDIQNPVFKSPTTGKKLPVKLGKNLSNIGVKNTKSVKTLIKTGAKAGAKKAALKGTGKLLAKRIPGIGAGISGAETFGRLATGDYVGAAISGAETIANLIPGVQQTVGTGLAGLGMARDIRRAGTVAKGVRKTLRTAKKSKGFKGFRKTPRVIPKKLPKQVKTPAGGQSKIGKTIFGRTPTGRRVRAGLVGTELVTGVGRKTAKTALGIGKAAVPNLDQGVVGRRTAG